MAQAVMVAADQVAAFLRGGASLRERLRLQALRVECRVDGFELHAFTAMTPMGPVMGNSDLGVGLDGLWHSTGPDYEPGGHTEANVYKSYMVKACGSFIVQRYGKAHKRRHTLIVGVGLSAILTPYVCGPQDTVYMDTFDPPEGDCDVLGGNRRVSARYRDVASVGALMFPPGSFAGPANHAVCNGEEGTLPAVHSQQAPVSVFVGMRRYELLAAMLREFGLQLANAVLDGLVSMVVEGALDAVMSRIPIVGRLFSRLIIGRILGPLVLNWLRDRIRQAVVDRVSDYVGDRLREAIDAQVRDRAGIPDGQDTVEATEELFNRWMEQT